jgi:opacity protein-like surface antigen
MRRIVIAALLSLVAPAAHAADMPDLPILRGSLRDGYGPPRSVWEGFYVGGQANYGSVVSNISSGINGTLQAPNGAGYNWPGLPSPHANNTGFGGFAGYNSSWEDVVIGLEANYIHGAYNTVSSRTNIGMDGDGNLITTSSQARVKLDDFGSLRLRAGYNAGNFLPYAFVGGGVGNMVIERNTSATIAGDLAPGNPRFDSRSSLVFGYSAGLGIDILLFGGVFVRAEYEFQRITSKDVDMNVNGARAGIGYKF